MQITITLKTDNAAFENNEGTETARILRKLADRLDGQSIITGNDSFPLSDINGNRVGRFETSPH